MAIGHVSDKSLSRSINLIFFPPKSRENIIRRRGGLKQTVYIEIYAFVRTRLSTHHPDNLDGSTTYSSAICPSSFFSCHPRTDCRCTLSSVTSKCTIQMNHRSKCDRKKRIMHRPKVSPLCIPILNEQSQQKVLIVDKLQAKILFAL